MRALPAEPESRVPDHDTPWLLQRAAEPGLEYAAGSRTSRADDIRKNASCTTSCAMALEPTIVCASRTIAARCAA